MTLADVRTALQRYRLQHGGSGAIIALTKAQKAKVLASLSPSDAVLVQVEGNSMLIDGCIVWSMKTPVDPFVLSRQEMLVHLRAGRTGN